MKHADLVSHKLGMIEIKSNWASERARTKFDDMLYKMEDIMQEMLDEELDGKWEFLDRKL